MPGMAPETADVIDAGIVPKIRLRRAKRPGQKAPGALFSKDSERAKEMGKRGGEAKAALSIRKAFPDMYGLAKRVWTDPQVQSTILDLSRAGLLHPTLARELLYVYNGRPAYKMQIQREKDPTEDAKREAMRAMPRAERRILMDLLRKATGQAALPQATVVRVETTKPVDAEVKVPEPVAE